MESSLHIDIKKYNNYGCDSTECGKSEGLKPLQTLSASVHPNEKGTQICIRPFVNVVMSHLLLALQHMTIDLFSSAVHSH